MTLMEELQRRGLIAQCTHLDKVTELFNSEKVTFYIGFDATADSLHVGHFLQLVVMSHMQRHGHRPIALLGTGTTMIGDPTGKTDMRKMLTKEDINYNADCFRRQMSRMIDFSDGKALMLQNGDWILNLNYMEFLRDIGVHFSVNKMLTAECFKTRLEKGLSFLEFNYMLLQSYDFYYLNRHYGCKVELGGDDQWSNILGGVDLIRRKTGEECYGLTFTLLTTKEGKKMGKTENGAVWLDPNKTSPYEFFQYWRNVADDDVIRCLKMLTFIPIEEIESHENDAGEQLNPLKERLAYEVTKMVHGKEEADKALNASRSLFVSNAESGDMPTTALKTEDFTDGSIGLLTLLVKGGLCKSNGEARRLVAVDKAVSVNDEKVTDPKTAYSKENFAASFVVKKGKKVFHKYVLE